MPPDDGYQTEKHLKETTGAIALGITEYFKAEDVNDKYEFVLFVVDRRTGILQYISDMPREDANVMMSAYLKRDVQ